MFFLFYWIDEKSIEVKKIRIIWNVKNVQEVRKNYVQFWKVILRKKIQMSTSIWIIIFFFIIGKHWAKNEYFSWIFVGSLSWVSPLLPVSDGSWECCPRVLAEAVFPRCFLLVEIVLLNLDRLPKCHQGVCKRGFL